MLDQAWRAGRDLDMAGLIHAVQSPPFDKVGVIDLETFFPAKERFALAMKLNNLIASPGFAAWMEGESLDVGSLLYTQEGKPRLSILSIAHLSDAERMFFVTILLNEVLAWIRTQPGTSSLRAILYMDEIFGYFPPTAKPPSKMPMLTLLKQARAFGLGVVLATQNPVDLDYKGLSNAGTWFLGRLQTKRDKERVLEGLEGASNAAGQSFDRRKMDEILSSLGNRVFLMNNVHEDQPVVFQTRWALSYLRGPLTREQIQTLMAPQEAGEGRPGRQPRPRPPLAAGTARRRAVDGRPQAPAPAPARLPGSSAGSRPVVPPDVPEFFIPRRDRLAAGGGARSYRPALLGVARLHYADKKSGHRPLGDAGAAPADRRGDAGRRLGRRRGPRRPRPRAGQDARARRQLRPACRPAVPGQVLRRVDQGPEELPLPRAEADHLVVPRPEGVLAARGDRNATSGCGSRRARARSATRRSRSSEPSTPRSGPGCRRRSARRASGWTASRPRRASRSGTPPSSFGNSVLGAFLGRKTITKTNVGKATPRRQGRRQGHAAERRHRARPRPHLDRALEKFTDLEIAVPGRAREAGGHAAGPRPWSCEPIELTPRKADITVEQVVLAWTPWTASGGGQPEAAY